jgi:DNA-binding NarL/FixJ family response regulator
MKMLTFRQKDCVIYAMRGMTNSEISGVLGLAELTVKAHLQASFKRLGVNSRTELVWRVLTMENEKLRAEVAELSHQEGGTAMPR